MSKRIKHPKGNKTPASLYIGCPVVFKCKRTNGKWLAGVVVEITNSLVGINRWDTWGYYAIRVRPSKYALYLEAKGLVVRRVAQ